MRTLARLLFFILLISNVQAQPAAVRGTLDLRNHDFAADPTFELGGYWEAYPGELYLPSDFKQRTPAKGVKYASSTADWSRFAALRQGMYEFGYVTYRLKIVLPDSFPSQALMVRDINTAYRVYVNGSVFDAGGKIGKNESSSDPGWRHVTRAANFKPGENELILLVSNFQHSEGGLRKPILMGNSDDLLFTRNLEVGGILFLTGCSLLAGIFALSLFWFKTSDVVGLFFFLFCGSFALFIINSGPHLLHAVFNNVSWVISVKVMWVSFYLSVIFYGYFLLRTFEDHFRPLVFHGITVLNALMILITMFTPVAFSTQIQLVYFSLLIVAVVGIALSALLEGTFSHKLAWVNTIGTVALLGVILQQIASYFRLTGHWPMWYVGGLAIFIFSQALVMAIKFGRNYRESSLAALAAAKTREEFLNTMSHELKTPMNAILGMATFLEKSELKAKQRTKLVAIKNNAEALMSMINDVLSISELGSGQVQLKKSVLDLGNSVESAISLSKQHLNKDTVQFKYYLDPHIPSLLLGDASRIKQVLMHLLNNAFKFTKKGEVVLRVQMVEALEGAVKINFKITDTGVGMNMGSRNVLSIFTQDKPGKRVRSASSGLGLSVTDELLETMGSKLIIRSKRNDGTEVSFDLVLEEYVETHEVTSLFKKNEIDPTLKILYAEDNPVNQKLIIMMLHSLGLKVDIAANGQEALQMAMKKYYNIILMDIQMPVMDGLEASAKIIEHSTSRPIIIATTANLAGIDRSKCFEAGMNDFLSKPIHQEDLKLAILKWQGLKKYLDDSSGDAVKLSS